MIDIIEREVGLEGILMEILIDPETIDDSIIRALLSKIDINNERQLIINSIGRGAVLNNFNRLVSNK